jgi:DNA transposition AAA+ family ATPase
MENAVKLYNETLRAALDEYKEKQKLSTSDLAKELNSNSTQVSKYLSGKPEGDVEKMESTIEDVLKSAARRMQATAVTLFECEATKKVAAALEMIRKTNDIGLIHGPAGVGKTCAATHYLHNNPSAVMLTVTKWTGSAQGLARTMFAAAETRGWKHNKTMSAWLVERFAASNRLIIVDNAHRLTTGGREWLFDFHDATLVPIALVGNPEILNGIKTNDQQFSRIGLCREIKMKDPKQVARNLLSQIAPGAKESIDDMAEKITEERGHARALKKHLLLLPEMLAKSKGDFRQAIAMAHTQLVSEYQLVG